jgi:uncharacterized damage-inducible protein DinB
MGRPLMEDAFAHHVWATLRVLDACIALSPDQLNTAVPGTYGSILDTTRHLVGSDAWYLLAMTDDPVHRIDEDHMDLPQLRAVMDGHGAAWSAILARNSDPDVVNLSRRENGAETRTTVGIRLAQVVHHGTDHRSQICTALTSLGVEPPAIDVWDFGELDGRVAEVPAPS